MPITPFHAGPGFFIKSFVRRRFSVFVFLLAQVFIDLETMTNILMQKDRLHTLFHTFLGSLIPILLAIVLAKPLLQFVAQTIFSKSGVFKKEIDIERNISFFWISVSGLFAGWSHVFLDGIMHSDVRPFFPFSNANPFLELTTLTSLHLACVVLGVLGALIWFVQANLKPKEV